MSEPVRDLRFPLAGAKTLLTHMGKLGYQATELERAVGLIRTMVEDGHVRLLSFTANMVSSGLRGGITWACEQGLANAVFTTAGAIDHDVAKCFGDYELGRFACDDAQLIANGYHRSGNILIPQTVYGAASAHLAPLWTKMRRRKEAAGSCDLNYWIGLSLEGHESSFLWQCAKRRIPVFCPAPTDGLIGLEMLLAGRKSGVHLAIDAVRDLRLLWTFVEKHKARPRSGIVLGGGVAKHHLIAANILHGGLSCACYFTTAQEYDGSLSGALPQEAKSWMKIRTEGNTALVVGDVTLTCPLAFGALAEMGIL